jgi:hypothetical protein
MFPKEIEVLFEGTQYNITYTFEVISKSEIQFFIDEVKTDLGRNLQYWVLHYYPLKDKWESQSFINPKLDELKGKIAGAIITEANLRIKP